LVFLGERVTFALIDFQSCPVSKSLRLKPLMRVVSALFGP
jgi:hypothetical protein